ncbi:MAG TPA: NmrA family NAD(P)-binding protein [Armatimonadota bacterium]
MILVTGAAGKTGQAVIRALRKRGADIRAFVHRQEHASAMHALGVSDIFVGDLRDQQALAQAMQGMPALYHIPPAVQSDEAEIGKSIIAAAQVAGVGYFVYHSVMHPQISALIHHAQKLQVEDALIQSDLPFTILQPASYMQNMLGIWERIVQQGIYTTTYGMDARMSLVDLDDVAEVAAIVLTEDGHRYATYELAGPEVLIAAQMAVTLEEKLGRPVIAEGMDIDQWEGNIRAAGMGEYSVTALAIMFRYYAQHGFTGNPHILASLLHRPPTAFAAFVERTMQQSAKG